MEALCAGAEIRDGTAAYESLLESVGKDVILSGPPDEPPLDFETFEYLRQVLAAAADGRGTLPGFGLPYDGFSAEAYKEVYRLLGTSGRRYLGIRGRHDSLVPDGRLVRAMLLDEAEAEEAESRQAGPTWSDPWSGPPSDMDGPDDWDPHWPEPEPLPQVAGFGLPTDRDRDRQRSG